jgi:hypothetical protein
MGNLLLVAIYRRAILSNVLRRIPCLSISVTARQVVLFAPDERWREASEGTTSARCSHQKQLARGGEWHLNFTRKYRFIGGKRKHWKHASLEP